MSATPLAPVDENDVATVLMGPGREGTFRARSSTSALPHVPGYEILSVIGKGGMGVVYLARQTALKRLVALKMIASDRASPAIRERFQTEAETIARLRHPNFVQIYDVDECGGRPYLALELVS